MTDLRVILVVVAVMVCTSLAARAQQPSGAEKCDADVQQRDAEWAASPDGHDLVASTLHTESDDLYRTWCLLWNTTGALDHGRKAEDFVRVLFTSDGIRPAFGVAAQNSGPGGGVAFDVSPAARTRPLRFEIRSEVRGSWSGSWDAGALLNIVGTKASGEAGHAYGSLEVQHVAATQRVYFIESAGVMSLWASRFVASLLYGLEARDLGTLAGSAAVLTIVAAFAGWLPARRASRIDPAEVLRES